VTRVIRQSRADTPTEVVTSLHEAFVAAQAAMAEGEPLVFVVDSPALLGQAPPEDSAVACGLLGLARAIAFEGRSQGWQANVVAVDPGVDADTSIIALASSAGLSGQVLNLSTAAVGKVVP
jgi:NAD(P)-dependent dehydrogenase (short-subunit alcohol dehydrogenase family)